MPSGGPVDSYSVESNLARLYALPLIDWACLRIPKPLHSNDCAVRQFR